MPAYNEVDAYKTLEDLLIPSQYADQDAATTYNNIVKDFNQARPTIMTTGHQWLFKHRRIEPNQYRLVHRNNIPELVAFSETPQRRQKMLDPFYSSSTLGIFNQTKPVVGAYGHYVINVPNGQYAKVMDKTEAKIYGPGQHVIHSNNFQFDPTRDLVNEKETWIQHKDLNILRVPAGKVATITVNGESFILESRPEPYVYKSNVFQLVGPGGQERFYDANTKSISIGAKRRLLPDVGEVAVVNQFGVPSFYPDEEKGHSHDGPIIVDDANARFDGFMSTNLENLEFPSAETKTRRKDEGANQKKQNYDVFNTSDPVEVGVKFFVCYRIKDPSKVLKHLDFKDIKRHIEFVVNTDMGKAIQRTSIQHLLASDQSTAGLPGYAGETLPDTVAEDDVSRKPRFWQDEVKTQLKSDLDELGIELIRLNIEEATILDEEIKKEMSKQAVIVAKAQSENSAIDTVNAVAQRRAELDQKLALKQQETETILVTKKAQAQLEAAEIEAQTTKVVTDASTSALITKGDALKDNDAMFQLELASKFSEAVQNGKFSSTMPLSDLFEALMKLLGMGKEGGQTLNTRPSDARLLVQSSPLLSSVPLNAELLASQQSAVRDVSLTANQ